MKKSDENHWEEGDHSGARFDLCTVYGHIHQQRGCRRRRPVTLIGVCITGAIGFDLLNIKCVSALILAPRVLTQLHMTLAADIGLSRGWSETYM